MSASDENRKKQAELIRTWKPEQHRKVFTSAGGAPRKYGMKIRDKMRKMALEGMSGYRIARQLGIPRMTVYREFGMQPQTWRKGE